MKKLYTLLFLVYGFIANAQIVNIPDANFKAKLLSASASNDVASTETPLFNQQNYTGIVSNFHSIDINNDGEIQVIEAQAIKYLKIQSSFISNLTGIEAFTNLQYLKCDNNQLTNLSLISLLNLKHLDCAKNSLTNLNTSQNSLLETLIIGYGHVWNYGNLISDLDLSQNLNLKLVDCSYNIIISLNLSGLTNLTNLYCKHNHLSNIDFSNITNLHDLKCSNNQLTNLNISSLSNLYYFDYSNNQLSNLDISLLQNLLWLNCSNNQLTNLNISSLSNLYFFDYSNNQISSLDVSVLTNLTNLNCSYNPLSILDVSQNTQLQVLTCSSNQLTSLDVSQNHMLIGLECQNNELQNIDVSHNPNLILLICNNNQLETIKINNGNSYVWSIFDNINGGSLLFENNPNLQYICADEEDVAMVQSKINAYGYASTCHVNSYCSFTPGGTFYTINGNSRFDGDANGCDSNDFGYPYLKFNVTDGTANGNFIANDTGAYFYDVHAGVHTMTPVLENPSYFNISPTTATIDFPTQASPFTQDFCITPNGVHHDLEVTVIPLGVARAGFDASYKVVYKNKGNQLENPTLTFAFDDTIMDFLTASATPTNQSTGLLSWNLGTLAPLHSGNFVVNFNLNAPTETPPLNGGDFLNYTATINPTATDETPTDNVLILNQTVVNSYDPNDKTCLEGETINPSMIGEYVHYQIRFENTGTYPAQNVVVIDMIDTTKFDISTLQIVSTSHSCYTRIKDNKVEFIFENINLPFDDATNDGYVVFKIKTLPTLTINSTISNTAEIYFDYNFPIITNTATSTYQVLANQDFDFEKEFAVYPNPVKNVLNINAKNGLEIQSLEIYNTLGQLVIAKPNFEQTIDVSSLPTGTYFIKASTEKGGGSVKFVKE